MNIARSGLAKRLRSSRASSVTGRGANHFFFGAIIEIGLQPGAADLGILGTFALSAQFWYIFHGFLAHQMSCICCVSFSLTSSHIASPAQVDLPAGHDDSGRGGSRRRRAWQVRVQRAAGRRGCRADGEREGRRHRRRSSQRAPERASRASRSSRRARSRSRASRRGSSAAAQACVGRC